MVASERGQVLLIGGLAIAIVFLTAIPLSNSLVVSESASSSETVLDIDKADQREASIERGLRALIRNSPDRSPEALNRSLKNFTRYYTQVSAQQDGVYVNATVNPTESEGGRLSQSSLDGFNEPDGNEGRADWSLTTDATQIEEFRVTVRDIPRSDNSPFTINVSEAGSSDKWTVTVDRNPSSDPELVVNGGSPTTVTLPVTVYISNGTYRTGTGPIEALPSSYRDTLNGPYNVHFNDSKPGPRYSGTYVFAADGDVYSSPTGSTTYRSSIIVPAIDLVYVGPDTTYERTMVIETS